MCLLLMCSFVTDSICNLEALESLICSNNRLVALPADIGRLTKLTEFDCEGNEIEEVPE